MIISTTDILSSLISVIVILPKKHFKILWQLCTASVAGVHGNKNAYCCGKPDRLAHEVENILRVANGVLDGQRDARSI